VKNFSKIIPVNKLPQFKKCLEKWYRKNFRRLPWRETSDPYHIWVSEVMLQQTQVNTVLNYYSDFIRQYPDIRSLASADLQQVLKSWELLGYYGRVRNLHKAAGIVAEQFQGYVPADYSQFRQLPGVGEYIAAAVGSLAFNAPYPVLDGNVKRVLARLFILKEPVNNSSAHKLFRQAAAYIFNPKNPGQFNQAMMELGAVICRPRNPQCTVCPVSTFCQAYATGQQQDYPKKVVRPKTPQYHIAVAVIQKNDLLLITRRPDTGLLGGLWEFPGGKIQTGETAHQACLREIKEEINLQIEISDYLLQVKHAYSHFKVILEIFLCRYRSGRIRLKAAVDYRWILPSQLDEFPFPAANHKFFPELKRIIK
jgi:A/G-specific adenine glycosylase